MARMALPQPTTVAALVERRLAQLSAPALKLARTAALAQASFSAELAATVLELHPLDIAEPWRELEAAQVIRDGAFAHDLIFEATRASVPAPIAQLLHRRIAIYLLQRQARPDHIWRRTGPARWNGRSPARPTRSQRARPRPLRSAAMKSGTGSRRGIVSIRLAWPSDPSKCVAKACKP